MFNARNHNFFHFWILSIIVCIAIWTKEHQIADNHLILIRSLLSVCVFFSLSQILQPFLMKFHVVRRLQINGIVKQCFISFQWSFLFFFLLLLNQSNVILHVATIIAFAINALLAESRYVGALIVSSILFAYLLFSAIEPSVALSFEVGHIVMAGLFASALIAYIQKLKSELTHQLVQQSNVLAGAIAHELKTPLCSILYLSIGQQANLQRLNEPLQISPSSLLADKEILISTQGIQRCAENALFAIDFVLTNLKGDVFQYGTVFQIVDVFKQALSEYPFELDESSKIQLSSIDDFLVMSNKLAIKHVFFNLLKNALYQIKSSGKGEIQIWTETTHKENIFHFKDTASGIAKHKMDSLFIPYLSKKTGGTGLGLPFCSLVMDSSGGKILCNSIENEYTHFQLVFPMISASLPENVNIRPKCSQQKVTIWA